MQTTFEQTPTTERRHDAYLEYEWSLAGQRELTDELTEASEKLSAAMRNVFDFELKSDGELYFQGGSVGDVLRNSVRVAEEIVQTNPQFMVELIRRRIELQEYDEQRRLALGSEGDPDVLVVLSPIPDAVLGGLDLGAYDVERKKTLARVYQRTETGIRSTSLSLDLSDRAGLQAIAREFGDVIFEDDDSEDILMKRFWGNSAKLRDPVTAIRRLYDEQLSRQYGGEWYAGRQNDKVLDALEFIKNQPDIVFDHLAVLADIKKQPLAAQDELKRVARYNFAAALDERKKGETVFGDAVDLAGSGDSARAAGTEYKSDCPTGATTTAEQAVNSLNGEKIVVMTCPYCGLKTVGDPCAFRLVCSKCDAEVRGGKIMSTGIGREAALQRLKAKELEEKKKEQVKTKIVKKVINSVFHQDGKYFETRERVGVGGMVQETKQITYNQWAAQKS